MSYTPDHAERTRLKILDAARRLFNLNGYNGVGIDAIMAEAGLTRGGFYAHFDSKEALFTEVLERMPEFQSPGMRRRLEGDDSDGPGFARAFIETYLSERHRANIECGCSLPALAGELPRVGPDARCAFGKMIEGVSSAVARDLRRERPTMSEDEAYERALASLALCVGAQLLARGINDETDANRLLAACRKTALGNLRE